jgi:hypothetical protein
MGHPDEPCRIDDIPQELYALSVRMLLLHAPKQGEAIQIAIFLASFLIMCRESNIRPLEE